MSSEARQSKQVPFYKQRWYLGLAAVVTLVGGGGLAIFKEVLPFFQTKPSQAPNTEIVFDRSEGMDQSFSGMPSKLEGARKAVDVVLRGEVLGDNLAFRAFGGRCDANYTPPTLPFSEKNAEAIRKKTEELKPEGQATLVLAIKQAIADFKDATRFGTGSKRVIVITGNLDACNMQVTAVVEDLAKVRDINAKISLDFDFIGIGLDYAGKAQLDDLADKTGGKAHFAENRQQLENIISAIEYERVMRAGSAVLEVLKYNVQRLNAVIGDLKRDDYTAAEHDLQQARNEFDRSELPFHDLGKRQTSEQYRQIYQAAGKNREIQSQVISLLEVMLSQAKASDHAGLQASSEKYGDFESAYNKREEELRGQLEQLRSQVH
jgi:hypothetical protein